MASSEEKTKLLQEQIEEKDARIKQLEEDHDESRKNQEEGDR